MSDYPKTCMTCSYWLPFYRGAKKGGCYAEGNARPRVETRAVQTCGKHLAREPYDVREAVIWAREAQS